jgi:caffeoyl-CoA O-methyltransferase
MAQTTPDTHEVHAYITHLFAGEDEVLKQIREEMTEQGLPEIAITPEEGAFLHLLVRLSKAAKALEIGTLAGYSAIWIARALPENGILFTVEKSAHHAVVARRNFEKAGVAAKIRILQGEAGTVLKVLAREAPFDFVFIDADKEGNPDYYEWALEHIPFGGVITVHNALWGGSVAKEVHGPVIDQVRAFNRKVAEDPRVVSHLYPAGDGTLIAVKK